MRTVLLLLTVRQNTATGRALALLGHARAQQWSGAIARSVSMHRSTWKAVERRWATRIGGERVPITGRQRGSAPDIAHDRLSVEVKSGKTISTRQQTAMEQAEASKRGDQVPVVLLTHMRAGNKGNVEAIMFEKEAGLHVLRLAGLID